MFTAFRFALITRLNVCRFRPILFYHLLEGCFSFYAFLISTKKFPCGWFRFRRRLFQTTWLLFLLTRVIFDQEFSSFTQILWIFLAGWSYFLFQLFFYSRLPWLMLTLFTWLIHQRALYSSNYHFWCSAMKNCWELLNGFCGLCSHIGN